MTQEEILDYNDRCAIFLGGQFIRNEKLTYEPRGRWHIKQFPNAQQDYDLKFDSDWNWIMEIKNKIISLKEVDEFNVSYDSVAKGTYVNILSAHKNTFENIYTNVCETEKEAVVKANNQFLIWYNKTI